MGPDEEVVLNDYCGKRDELLKRAIELHDRRTALEKEQRNLETALAELKADVKKFEERYGVTLRGKRQTALTASQEGGGHTDVSKGKSRLSSLRKLIIQIGVDLLKKNSSFWVEQVFVVIKDNHAELYPDINVGIIERELQKISKFACMGKGSSSSGNLVNHYVLTPQKPSPPPVKGEQSRSRKGKQSLWGRRNDHLVIEVMEELQRPLTPKELAQELRQRSVTEEDLLYRLFYSNLARLARIGMIRRDTENHRVSLPSKQVA